MTVEDEELYSLLVPLHDERLIVPRACVAEVVRYASTDDGAPAAHDWLRGTVNWNGRQLPVVSFEGLLGRPAPPVTGRTRIVVFVASAGHLRNGYFGILTQGFPQLVRVNREVLKLDATEGWPAEAPVLCRVKMINEYPLIPDLDRLEETLSRDAVQV